MKKPTVVHYDTCTANYPEKLPWEAPQELTRVDLSDGWYVWQCVDCGAHSEILKDEGGVDARQDV